MQTALNVAIAGDSLWVANGTYYPGASGVSASTFDARTNVRLFGGFQGFGGAAETMLSQRNWFANLTILSGDLDQSNSFTSNDAYHVISSTGGVDTSATFDGFRITGGNAYVASGVSDAGGAVLFFGAGIRLNNCDVRGNRSLSYGGAFYGNGHLIVTNSFIRFNFTSGQGGAGYFAGALNVHRFYNCVFSNNTAASIGGAILNGVANTRYFNCTFSGNAGSSGSTMSNFQASALLQNCIVWGETNPATTFQGTVPTVTRCIVQGGLASGTNILNANPEFRDSDFRIKSCSPAADAGDSLTFIATDLDGAPRPFDVDNNSVAKWDLGAFEAQVLAVAPAANPIAGPNPSCANQQNVLYQPTTNNSPTNNYAWTLSGGGTIDGGSSNPDLLIDWGTTLGTYTITMVETGAISGCSTVTTLPVSLQTAPTVTLTPNGNGAICQGDSIQLTGNGTGVSRQWYRNGAAIPGATASQYFAQLPGAYNMVLTGANTCADSAAQRFNLTVNPLPNFNINTSTDPSICIGETVILSGPGSGNAYQWYRNGLLLGGATSPSLNVSTAAYYNLLFTDGNNCRDSANSGVQVVVHSLPVVTITPAGADTICPGTTLNLMGTAPLDSTWQWYRNGAPIGGANASNFTASLTGLYNVRIMDTNGCSDSMAVGKALRVQDYEAPDAICQARTIYLNGSGSASLAAAQIDNGSTDDCGIASLGISPSTFACANTGPNNVTLTVTDLGGNTDQCVAVVTVLDSIKPVAVCANPTLYLGPTGLLSVGFSHLNGGSSDNCSISSTVISPSNFTCADTGAHVLTMTLSDPSGNTRVCTANVVLEDSTRPNAVCANPTVALNGGGTASIVIGQVENGSSDNCGIASSSLSRTNFNCADVPGVFVTLSVRDVSGNTGTCLSYVRVQDNLAPVAVCRDTTIYIDSTGQSLLTPANVDGGSNDNCSILTALISQNLFTCADTGVNNVTLTVADADTNMHSCLALVTVRDTVAPIAVCSDTTFYLNASGIAAVDPLVLGINSFDNCNYFDTAYVNVAPYTCAGIGTHPVLLVVGDVTGARDSCSGMVTIADTTGPAAQCQNFSVVLSVGGNATITSAMVDNGTVDNCQLDTIFLNRYNFTCADVGPQNVVLTAVDIYGNDRQCTSVVTVQDNVAPVAQCQPRSIYLDASGNASTTAAAIDNGSSDNCTVASMSLSQTNFSCANLGANSVTLSVLDGGGNLAQCNATITVIDTIRPVAQCMAHTLYLNAAGQATLTAAMIDAGSTDNCPISSFALSSSSFACQDTGVQSVTLTVNDQSGNNRQCIAAVTIRDTTPPVANCGSLTAYLNGSGVYTLSPATVSAAFATDNCGIASTLLSQSAFSCSNVGANALTATFRDVSGNTRNCGFNLTVIDSVAPTMACVNNPTVYLDGAGFAAITLAMIDAGSSDICGVNNRVLSQSSVGCQDVGTLAVLLTVTDASSNSASCTAQLSVIDSIRPQIQCTPQSVSLDSSGLATVSLQALSSGSTDVCGIALITASDNSFDCSEVGVNVLSVTVEDPAGNQDTCTVSVTVADNMAPIARCDTAILQLNAAGTGTVTPSAVGGSSWDNCTGLVLSLDQGSFTCADFGYQAVLLTVEDGAGLRDSCNGVVQVVDNLGLTEVPVSLGGDTAICNGTAITLDAGTGHSAYLWSTNATTQSIQVSSGGNYSVQVTSAQGCTGSDTVTVSAFTSPNPNLRTESGYSVICQNDSLLLIVDSVFAAYQWSTGSTAPTTLIYTGGTYIVELTDMNGCVINRSISIQSFPFPAPIPVITPSDTVPLCENASVSLDAGPGYFDYHWNTGQTTQIINVGIPGNYYVEVWNGFGCHSVSEPVFVQSEASPQPDIFRVVDTLFTSVVGSSYQWYLGTAAIPGATLQRHEPALNGNYSVEVFYANGCRNISEELSFTVGVDPGLEVLAGLNAYPNPTLGSVNLASEKAIRQPVHVRVMDLYGRVCMEMSWANLLRERTVSLAGFPAGLYLIEVESAHERAHFQILKQ